MFSPQACAEKHLSMFHTEASLNPVFDSGTTSLGDGGLLQQAEFSVHVNLNFFFFWWISALSYKADSYLIQKHFRHL